MLNALNYVQPVEEINWLSYSPQFGNIASNDNQQIILTLDATELMSGSYNANIIIANNDPDENPTIIPIILEVSPPTIMNNFNNDFIPTDYQLIQNYPNPFNSQTLIKYQLPNNGHIMIIIYNLQGQKITTLVNYHQQAANYSVIWNGCDYNRKQVPLGLYLYQLKANNYVEVKRCYC